MKQILRLAGLSAIVLALSILQLSGIGYALSVEPRGIQEKVGSATYWPPSTSITVSIPITMGDANNFANSVTATISWDYSAVIAATLLVHKMALKDDANNEALTFIDAVAGGIYKRAVSYYDAIGYTEYYIIHEQYKKLGALYSTITIERTFYIKASSEEKAEAKLGLELDGLGFGYTVEQAVKQGAYYAVTVSLQLKRALFYIDYEAKIERVYITPDGSVHKEYRYRAVCPQITGYTI